MREQIVALSMAAANQLVHSGMDEKSQRAEVERFFTALPAEAATLGDGLVVVTAVPLTDKEKAAAKKDLGTEAVEFETDPSILGGVIVRAAGQQIDASFASQLSGMRMSLS
jgi:flagellar biosynthesis/type III secretory pathway protein FliH